MSYVARDDRPADKADRYAEVEAEILAVLDATIAEVGATGPADLGKLMGPLKAKLGGKADMGQVSALAKKRLAG